MSDVTAASSNVFAARPAAATDKKRKADQLVDGSTSVATPNSNGRSTFGQSLAPPQKVRHVKLPPPRRPERTGEWYSVTPGEWDGWAPEKRRKQSHVGIIEETEHGMLAPEPCVRCSNFGRPVAGGKSERLVCKVYKESAIGVQ